MNFIEDTLNQAVNEAFNEGKGLDEPLANAVRSAGRNSQFLFSLQTKCGFLLDTAHHPRANSSPPWKQSAFQAIVPDDGAETRFVFSISPKVWEILSCFMVNNSAFYATITMSGADSVEQCLRAGIIRLMSSLCLRCRAVLYEYMRQLIKPADNASSSDGPYAMEKLLLRRIAEFSNNVNCVALIDHDGFILNTSGNVEEVEKIASNLALFHQRCVRELGCMGSVNPRSETFSCAGRSVLIGQIERTNLALALSARGEHARSFAAFLFELAQNALTVISDKKGTLWGSPLEKKNDTTRVRTSWFGPVQLVSQGRFVGKKGGKAFHLCSCKSLCKSDDQTLDWFEKRADAIRAGLIPCRSCNP